MYARIKPMNALERERTGAPLLCEKCDTEVSVVKVNERDSKYYCPHCANEQFRQNFDDIAELDRLLTCPAAEYVPVLQEAWTILNRIRQRMLE